MERKNRIPITRLSRFYDEKDFDVLVIDSAPTGAVIAEAPTAVDPDGSTVHQVVDGNALDDDAELFNPEDVYAIRNKIHALFN